MIRSQDPFGIFVCLIHCRKVLKKMQSAFCSHYFIFQQMDIFGHTDMKGINGWWPKSCLSRGLNIVMHTLLEPAQRGARKETIPDMLIKQQGRCLQEGHSYFTSSSKEQKLCISLSFQCWALRSPKLRKKVVSKWSCSAAAPGKAGSWPRTHKGPDELRVTGKVWKMPILDTLSYLHVIINQQENPEICTEETPSLRMVIMPMSGVPDSPCSFK